MQNLALVNDLRIWFLIRVGAAIPVHANFTA